MDNTKALEVALDIRNKCVVFGDPHYGTRFYELSARAIIQAAIDEATADLRTQLAERDAQLAAERERLHELLERSCGILENVAIADSGDAEQDEFERETFEDVKKELGK